MAGILPDMGLQTVEERKNDILKHFREGVSKVVLYGDAGTGKTWMAKLIHDVAVQEGLCNATLWLSLNRKHEKLSLYQNIACQLSLFSIPQECEEDLGEKENAAEDLEKLKRKISVELERRRLTDRSLLLVLDDEGNKMTEKQIMEEFGLERVLTLKHTSRLKLLISRRVQSREPSHDISGSRTEQISRAEGRIEHMEFRWLPTDDLQRVFQEILLKDIKAQIPDHLSKAVIEKSKNLPAAIVFIAGALNYIHSSVKNNKHITRSHSGIWTLEGALEDVDSMEQVDEVINPLICCTYGILADTALIDCFWHSCQLFEKYGAVHFNELICHWILEGYFGPVDRLEKVYKQAHIALIELIDFGVLKMEEENFVVVERAILNNVDPLHYKICGSANLGLPHVLNEWKGLGRTVQMDGTIKTVPSSAKAEMVSTLMIDGSCVSSEVLDTLFKRSQELQVLAVFELQLLPFSKLEMQNLTVFVLSGCSLLKDVSHIKKLKSLHVLQITDAAALTDIPDDMFAEVSELRSLNLSAIGIESLPSTLSKLTQLSRLILRRSQLKKLPTLVQLQNLEVLDVSGSESLNHVDDNDFCDLKKLQVLDFSQTKIKRIPIVKDLKQLTRLILKGCCGLSGLGRLDELSNLQILDLSGATGISNMDPRSFQRTTKLKVLDLSGTKIKALPPKVGNLSLVDLKLRSCPNIVRLPCINALTGLERLDLSDANNLKGLEDQSFEELKCLQYLNLSNTKLEKLPSLSKLEHLLELILRCCKELQTPPEFSGLKRLEVLDLSDCEKMPDMGEDSFSHMSHLQTLNLSGTNITFVPPLCQPSKLQRLYLGNCSKLQSLPELDCLTNLEVFDLSDSKSLNVISAEFLSHTSHLQILKLSKITLTEFQAIFSITDLKELSLKDCSGSEMPVDLKELTKLQVLELSGEAVGSLLSLDKLGNLKKLILNGCSRLGTLPSLKSNIYLEVLDLSGTQIQQLPQGISELSLKYLHLPDLGAINNFGWGKLKQLPKELKYDSYGTLVPSDILENGKKPSIVFNDTGIFKNLSENSELEGIASHLFRQSVISVWSAEEKVQSGDEHHHDDALDKFIFSDVYHQTRYFPNAEKDGKSVELCGFDRFPFDVREVVEQAEYVSLVENAFMSHLSDLNPGNLNNMKVKGCWIERCTNMASIFCGENDVQLGENVETLWLSNLPSLDSFYSGGIQSVTFNNLSHLHLDCCPKLRHVFPSPEMPKNLQILQIKFCDKLETVFVHDEPSEVRSCKLHTLLLLGLPELKSIGVKMPPIQKPRVWRCPKLNVAEEDLRSGQSSSEITEL